EGRRLRRDRPRLPLQSFIAERTARAIPRADPARTRADTSGDHSHPGSSRRHDCDFERGTRVRNRWGISLLLRGCVAGEGCAGLRVLSLVLGHPPVSERGAAAGSREDYSTRSTTAPNRLSLPVAPPSP